MKVIDFDEENAIKINKNDFRNISKGNLKVLPELRVVKRGDNLLFVYSPLNLKLYVFTKDEFKRLKKLELDPDERKFFFENDILIERNNDPYPKISDAVEPDISLTNRCNMNCIYCYSGNTERTLSNSFENIKSLIDYCLSHSENIKKQRVLFFSSGESTIEFELMKRVYKYFSEKVGKNKSPSIVTNGVFSKRISQWLMENKFNIQISADGPPHIQDLQRPLMDGGPSSSFVEDILKYFVRKNYPHFYVNSVITRYSLDSMIEIFTYFYRLGVKNAVFSPVFRYGKAKENMTVDPKKFADILLKITELSEWFGARFSGNVINFKVRAKGCGIGNLLLLREDGKIVTCPNAVYDDAVSKLFTVGKIEGGKVQIDEKKRRYILSRTVDNIRKCTKCPIKWNCGGGCALHVFIERGNIFDTSTKCKMYRYAFKRYVDFLIESRYRKMRPWLREKDGKLYLEGVFSTFELEKVRGGGKISSHSFIIIKSSKHLKTISKKISLLQKVKGYKPVIFVLSFRGGPFDYEKNSVNTFLKTLKNNRIFFLVSRPVCRKILGTFYEKRIREFRIPKNWEDSLELFLVKGRNIELIDGRKIRMRKNMRRETVSPKKFPVHEELCKKCIYKLRNTCGLF